MNESEIERGLGTDEPHVDTEAALARFGTRMEEEGVTAAPPAVRRRVPARWLQGLAAAAGVVLVAGALTLSGVADSILKIFEPKSVVGVPVTQQDLSYLGKACAGLDLQQCMGTYGTFEWTTPPQPKEVQSLASASSTAGYSVQTPSSLLTSVTGPTRYGVVNRSNAPL